MSIANDYGKRFNGEGLEKESIIAITNEAGGESIQIMELKLEKTIMFMFKDGSVIKFKNDDGGIHVTSINAGYIFKVLHHYAPFSEMDKLH